MNYIRKVVVADDEAIQRQGLSQILRRLLPEAQIYLCCNGKEAYEQIGIEEIDLLITDIRMPVMDGMELIRQVHERNQGIQMVLISAYQEFEYARTAIRYGVTDYLVKPYSIETVKKLLAQINDKLSDDRKNQQEKDQYERLLSQSQEEEWKRELSLAMNGLVKIETLAQENLRTLNSPGVIILLRWKKQQPERVKRGCINEQQQSRLLKEISDRFQGCLLVPMEKGLLHQEYRLAVIAASYTDEECRDILIAVAEQLKMSRTVFWCGISGIQTNLAATLVKATEEAEEILSLSFFDGAVKNVCAGGIYLYDAMCDCLDAPICSVSSFEEKLKKAVHKGDEETVREQMQQLADRLDQQPYLSPFKVKHTISSMVMRLARDLEGIIQHKIYDELLNELYKKYGECDSYLELFQISVDVLVKAAAYFSQETDQYDAVLNIISYMKKHFHEEITLQQLADKAHFSENYLSAQIKKRTGMTYAGFLMHLRMERASTLLLQTDQKVVDIAGQCGIHDSSYFNRVFRRQFNLSPEQYRKVHKKC